MARNANTKQTKFVTRLERAINGSDLTQSEIAEKLGYDNANMITMIKKGSTRLPPEKVAAIAKALDLDPGQLVREWFESYMPDFVPDLDEYVGTPLSRSEKAWVRGLRKAFGTVPAFDDRWASPIKELIKESVAEAKAA